MSELTITIVSGGMGRASSLDVAQETELVKSALLYADNVILASPRVAMLATFATIARLDPKQRRDAVLTMLRALPEMEELQATLVRLQRKKNKSHEELLLQMRIQKQLDGAGGQLVETVLDLLDKAGAQELAIAVEAGVLQIDDLGLATTGDTKLVPYEVARLLETLVAPGSTAFPMLDEVAGDLLRAMVNEGVVVDPQLAPASEPALSARFMDNLVAYPSARMEAILEFREDLRDPLLRYRSKVIGLADEMKSTVLDHEFAVEAEKLYRRDVQPELLHLQELAQQRGLVSLLVENTIDLGLGKIAAGGLGFGVLPTVGVPSLIGAGLGLAAEVVASALQDSRALDTRQRQNGYFYLYSGGERLGKS